MCPSVSLSQSLHVLGRDEQKLATMGDHNAFDGGGFGVDEDAFENVDDEAADVIDVTAATATVGTGSSLTSGQHGGAPVLRYGDQISLFSLYPRGYVSATLSTAAYGGVNVLPGTIDHPSGRNFEVGKLMWCYPKHRLQIIL